MIAKLLAISLLMELNVHPALARDPERPAYIENQLIRLGVDLSAGGSIFHFGPAGSTTNLLNHYDEGRFIQQSYYGTQDGSVWASNPWRWNPVQGGGCNGKPSKVLESHQTSESLRVVSIPAHWATGALLEDCRMESTIRLNGPVAHIQFAFRYTGTTNHPAHHQELPAVFVDADYPELVLYQGNAPWTGAALTRKTPGWPNEQAASDEHWAAYINEKGEGIGVFFPGTPLLTTYRYKGNGKTGPNGSACSYFAPIRTFAISPGTEFRYDVYLTLGNVETIRSRFKAVHDQSAKPHPASE